MVSAVSVLSTTGVYYGVPLVIERDIVVTIDTLMDLFRDYIGDNEIPMDARPIKLMFNPGERRKLAIMAESDEWREGMGPLVVAFDIKRIYGV